MVPGVASTPVSEQVWAPVLQVVTPTSQALVGVQARPDWQGTQAPLPLQVPGAPPPASQVTEPAATGVAPTQAGPLAQVTVPVLAARQTLADVQLAPTVQA